MRGRCCHSSYLYPRTIMPLSFVHCELLPVACQPKTTHAKFSHVSVEWDCPKPKRFGTQQPRFGLWDSNKMIDSSGAQNRSSRWSPRAVCSSPKGRCGTAESPKRDGSTPSLHRCMRCGSDAVGGDKVLSGRNHARHFFCHSRFEMNARADQFCHSAPP